MAWGEDAGVCRAALVGEGLQVRTGAVFVVVVAVAVVHQHPLVGADEREGARPLYGHTGLLQVGSARRPFAVQRGGSGLLYAIAVAFGLEEHVIPPIVPHDVGIDGAGTVVVEHLGLGQLREVGIGIRVVDLVVCVLFAYGVIYHILSGLGVVDGLRGPHLCECLAVEAVGPRGGEVDGRVLPVCQVLRAEQHQSVVRRPSVARLHVRHHHIVAAVLAPQDVGVAHGLLLCNGVGSDDGVAAVEWGIAESVVAEGKAYLLLPLLVAIEVGKEVRCVSAGDKAERIGLAAIDEGLYLATGDEGLCRMGGDVVELHRLPVHCGTGDEAAVQPHA